MLTKIRTLAALDIAFLGATLIIAEFAFGVVGPIALGVLTLRGSHSMGGMLFGAYLVSLGLNYVPLLMYAIVIARRGTAQAEILAEPSDRQQTFRTYRRQSLWLLVPLVVPILAIRQEWQARRRSDPAAQNGP